MSAKEISQQLDSLAKKAQNYRYQGAYERLAELERFLNNAKPVQNTNKND